MTTNKVGTIDSIAWTDVSVSPVVTFINITVINSPGIDAATTNSFTINGAVDMEDCSVGTFCCF